MARFYFVVAFNLVAITRAETRRNFTAAFIPLTPVKRFCGCALLLVRAMALFAGGAIHLVAAITKARARCEFAAFFPFAPFKRHGGEAFFFVRAMLRFAAGTSQLVFMTRAPTLRLSAATVPLAILKGLTGEAFHVLAWNLLRASFIFAVGTFDVVFFPSAPTESLFFAHIFQKFRTLLAFGVTQHRIQKFRTLLAFSVQQHRIPNDI